MDDGQGDAHDRHDDGPSEGAAGQVQVQGQHGHAGEEPRALRSQGGRQDPPGLGQTQRALPCMCIGYLSLMRFQTTCSASISGPPSLHRGPHGET